MVLMIGTRMTIVMILAIALSPTAILTKSLMKMNHQLGDQLVVPDGDRSRQHRIEH